MNAARFLASSVILAGGVALGVCASHLLMRNAHADARPSTSTIFVPSEGLVFRTTDGRAIARLSSDASGGTFELYDAREQPTHRVRATPEEPLAPRALRGSTAAPAAVAAPATGRRHLIEDPNPWSHAPGVRAP